MKKWMLHSLGLLLLVVAGCSRPAPAPARTRLERVDLSVLLARMTNVTTFAEAPLGNAFLESSYDRSGGNRDWATHTKAMPNGRITIFEAEGPGYISRFWIASFSAERWLFFFDGEKEPRLDLAKDVLFGERFPFVAPLAGKSGGGRYSLMPIPFSKSLRIEMVPISLKPTRDYFQINHTLLDMDSGAVVSFPRTLSAAESNQVAAVNAAFENNEDALRRVVNATLSGVKSATLAAGDSMSFWEDDGAGVMESFCVRIDAPTAGAALSAELLRGLRLQMFWDGMDKPSVDVPLGDFFCNPWYFRSYSSLPLGRVDDAFVCRFPMPYEKGARCVLTNRSGIPVSVSLGAQGNRASSDGLNRNFHAAWRASTRAGRPLEFMNIEGAGHYVGCFLSAIGQDGTWTILEGDEFLKPDAGEQPAQLGTGLEDYFNGAYYYTSLFDLPFHGLIEKGAMRTDQYRLHMLDAVAFDQSFKAGIEFGDGNNARGYMSSLVYWYADQAAPVPLRADYTSLLARPKDRFELHGLMAQLFLLERDGLYADAAARMEFFSERLKAQPWCDLLKVRALGYREKVDGFSAVREGYEQMAKSTFLSAAQAAQAALWMQDDASHALLGIHALAQYQLKMDGNVVAEGEGKNGLQVLRLQIEPGEHIWEVELAPTRQGSFFALSLQSAAGTTTAAGDWETLSMQENPGKKVPEVWGGERVLPNMSLWAFEPNAYVNMQSGSIITLWNFWDSAPLVKQLALRKSFVLGNRNSDASAVEESERSADELRTHAIN
jgi:hypothetical protein